MGLRINEQTYAFDPSRPTIGDWRDALRPAADVLIRNGFPVPPETPIADGDVLQLIERGATPSAAELESLLVARHSPGVHQRVKRSTVAVCGVGGLGSLVAISLARMGVGRLLLVDFDVVEPSNLNRQQYFVEQIGQPKVTAMAETLERINPYVTATPIEAKLQAADFAPRLGEADVIAECFDTPASKVAAFEAARTAMRDTPFVFVSGLAGYAAGDSIRVRRLRENAILVGDEIHAAQVGSGLMAPRVAVAAGMQANVVLRLLLGLNPVDDSSDPDTLP